MADMLEATANIDNPRNRNRDVLCALLVSLGLWAGVISLAVWFFL